MTLNTVIESETGTYAEILSAVRGRTVSAVGEIPVGFAQTLLVQAFILPTITKIAKLDDHINPVFQGACQALMARINGNQAIDLALPGVEEMFDLILEDTEVAAKLSASEFANASTFKAAVIQSATVINPEFPGVTLHDVITVKTPALAAAEYSNAVTIKGISQVLKLTTFAAMPEPVACRAEVSTDGIVWTPIVTAMLDHVAGATTYPFRVLPGPVFIAESQIRVVSPYSVGLVLA